MAHCYQILTVSREVHSKQLDDTTLFLALRKRARLQSRCIVCTKKPVTALATVSQAEGETVVIPSVSAAFTLML